jgi:hypothetical protein
LKKIWYPFGPLVAPFGICSITGSGAASIVAIVSFLSSFFGIEILLTPTFSPPNAHLPSPEMMTARVRNEVAR